MLICGRCILGYVSHGGEFSVLAVENARCALCAEYPQSCHRVNQERLIEREPVIYVPFHAHGNLKHPDCEHGVVKSTDGGNAFCHFKTQDGKYNATAMRVPMHRLRFPNRDFEIVVHWKS